MPNGEIMVGNCRGWHSEIQKFTDLGYFAIVRETDIWLFRSSLQPHSECQESQNSKLVKAVIHSTVCEAHSGLDY